MPTSIQNPERVLNILRSSTLTSRLVGMGWAVRRAGSASMVSGGTIVAVSRSSFALGVGSECHLHVLEPLASGGPELGEGDASCQGHRPHPSRVGVRAYRAVPCKRAGDPGPFEGVREVAR